MTGLRSSIIVRDSDIYCPRSYRASNNTASKVQTKETTAKNFHLEEPKVKKAKLTLFRAAEASKPSEQARKERKKKKY